jgi:tetratricopeptide (TPR) repeat protein
MNKENILFSLVGIGFGLFFGFFFVAWANERAHRTPRDAGTPSANQNDQTSNAEADAAIKRARDNPNDFTAQMEAARVYYDTTRYDEAIQLLLHANDLQPENPEPVVALGHVNDDAGNYKAAEKWYTAALVKNPDDANVRASLGRVLLLSQPPDYDAAIKELRHALESDPNHEPSLQFLAFALARKGDTQGARDALARLEKVNPDNTALPQLRQELDAPATKSSPQADRNRPAAANEGARNPH